MKTFVYIDTETSSLEVDRGEVLQLSAVKFVVDDNIIPSYAGYVNSYLKPSDDIKVDFMAMNKNGICLSKCVRPKIETFEEFNDFCKGCVVVGYNVGFDINMINDDMMKEGIKPTYSAAGVIDVLDSVKKECQPLDHATLTNVSKYYGFKGDDFHNSLADSLATAFVYFRLAGVDAQILGDMFGRILNKLSGELHSDEITYCKDKCIELFKNNGVCISGDFADINRKHLEEVIVECGGSLKSGMTKNVNIFINGFNLKPTSKEKKYDELTQKQGLEILKLNEEQLKEMIKIRAFRNLE